MKVLAFSIPVFLFFLSFSDQVFAQKSELAWVHSVSTSTIKGFVRVETVKSKILIDFAPENFKSLILFTGRVGGLTTVSFDCVKNRCCKDCELILPYQFFVDGENAKILRWEFLKASNKALIHHGPGDKKGSPTEVIAEITSGSKSVWFHLRISDIRKTKAISKIKRDNHITISFPADQPRKAFIKGAEMDIVGVML